MGLDQYAYKARKLTQAEINEIRADGPIANTLCIDLVEEHDFETLFGTVKDQMVEIDLPVMVIDYAKARLDQGIPSEAKFAGGHYSGNWLTETYELDGEKYTFEVEYDRLKKRYGHVEPHPHMCLYAEEIHYWRKAYDIQKVVYEQENASDLNVAYVRLTQQSIYRMMDLDETFAPPMLRENEFLIYHEWY